MSYQKTISVLDQITGLCRALRQGGPDPMDLQGLSDALEEAIYLAKDEMERLVELGETQTSATSGQYPTDAEVERAVAETINPDAWPPHYVKIVMWACDWAAARQREKDAQICDERARKSYLSEAKSCAAAIRSQTTDHFEDVRETVPPPAKESVPVAHLDIGAGGYIDLGSDLTDEQLSALPKGRHMLGIVGTFGVDGYQPAPAPVGQIAVDRTALARWELAMTRSLGEYPIRLLAESSVEEMRAFLGVEDAEGDHDN